MYRVSSRSDVSTPWSFPSAPASATPRLNEKPGGSSETAIPKASSRPTKMTAIWAVWVRLTARLPPMTV